MKDFYFLVSLPRAGNTLLATLINQNDKVCCTSNSIILDILWDVQRIKKYRGFLNFPDETSLDNVLTNVTNNYYKDFKANKIIDRGCWATDLNYKLLKDFVTPKPKFILLYRPIAECYASFMKAGIYKNENEMVTHLMSEDGFLNMAYTSISNVLKSKDDYIFLTYNELVRDADNTVEKIFNFIDEKYVPIKTKNFKQFSANNIVYDDSVLSAPHHIIRTKKITKQKLNVEDYISKELIEKSKEWDNKIFNV